jgi:peroxiredoxin Q/BCP
MRMRTLLAAGLAVLSLGAQAAPEVGDPAPDFTLPGSDGAMHSLSDYRGRYVVIAFFPKAFTGG